MSKFADRLLQLRQEANLTQEELSNNLNLKYNLGINKGIEKLEQEGWTYEHEFRLPTGGNTLVQFPALVKDGYYRKIQNGRIGPPKIYMSDEDIELMKNSWGGAREGAGRKSTGRKKKIYYVTDDEDAKLREYLQELRNEKPR